MTSPVGIYIHVPFCESKCLYCDFHSVTGMEGRINEYVNTLLRELTHYAKDHPTTRIGSVFFGGGTPSLIAPANIKNILDSISHHFSIISNAEITIESNPEGLTLSKLKGYRGARVNRISVGVQSLDDQLLKRLGRIHSAKRALQSLQWAREAGFSNLSADFMFNLPEQTEGQWNNELGRISDLGLDHLSIYELTLEPGTPMWRERKKLKKGDSMTMFNMAESILKKSGFQHYEISNYSKPGLQCAHNLGYWQYRDYIGIGAGAHGCMDGHRYVNVKNIDSYIERVSKRSRAVYRSEAITAEREGLERLMLGLRLKKGIALNNVEVSLQINKLIADRLLTITGGRLKATGKGWRMLDSVLENI